ncbi:MAG TPA: exopolyphosphatase [Azospira sp.]|nr:exopolyphosphatase [Azospira sp.]
MRYELIAAVDLGSNSFRLQVGRVVDDQIYPLDSLKEPVRLASGLSADKYLNEAAQERALVALRLFGERLRGFAPEAVRVVATNTLRVAKNAPELLPRLEEALGFPIEIIAGREEARLIYIGAAHSLPPAEHKRLVFDIGGGSTEFIIGRRFEPQLLESLYMGCVSYTGRFFPDGKVDKKRLREAEVAAGKEIQTIAHDYQRLGWSEAVGSSGTARAIADVLELNGLNPGGVAGITREGLARLRAILLKAGSAEAMPLEGLRNDRTPVLSGGIAIMGAIFETLQLEHMTYGDGALRLGVLYDLLGRFHHHDMRDSTVASFMRRYQVDLWQSQRVEQTAGEIFSHLSASSPAADSTDRDNAEHFLRWAAKLHEIGISIAHNGYHKHGAYILTFADMPGFSKKDQARLAMLVLGHRGKLDKVMALPRGDVNWLLILSLRLAVLFHRSRSDQGRPPYRIAMGEKGVSLELPTEWLAANPLTTAAFSEEIQAWQRVGLEFRLKRSSAAKSSKQAA